LIYGRLLDFVRALVTDGGKSLKASVKHALQDCLYGRGSAVWYLCWWHSVNKKFATDVSAHDQCGVGAEVRDIISHTKKHAKCRADVVAGISAAMVHLEKVRCCMLCTLSVLPFKHAIQNYAGLIAMLAAAWQLGN